jgi:hypothetical protein
VNGVPFSTVARNVKKMTPKSKIMIGSTHGEDEDMIACHGTLKEIIKLQYHGERSVVLFRCDWSKCEEKTALKNE